MPYQPINITGATLSLVASAHGDATITANRAAGITFTLPASEGKGAYFRIIVGTTITSNSLIVKVANATDVMTGVAVIANDTDASMSGFETASTSDTITMNGSTTGGIKGDIIECEDVSSGLWSVKVTGSATGTEATPFSATVS